MLPTTDHVIDGVRCAVHDTAPGNREAVVWSSPRIVDRV